LNASFNISQVVQIDDVKPDNNGEVFIDVSLGTYAMYAYLNGMVINGYKRGDTTSTGGSGRGIEQFIVLDKKPATVQPAVIATTAKGPVTPVEAVSQVSVYPNPFADDINVSLSLENDLDRVTIRLTDAAGHVVYNKDFSGLRKGEWRQQLQIPGEQLTAGVYILEIRGSDKTLPPRTFKLIKNR
jgi:hypothetical protein